MAAPGRAGSRADIEARLPPPQGPTLLDVSLTHPRAATYVTAAGRQVSLGAEVPHKDSHRVVVGLVAARVGAVG